ncbi:MAG: spore germination protein [Bacilli bacterium]
MLETLLSLLKKNSPTKDVEHISTHVIGSVPFSHSIEENLSYIKNRFASPNDVQIRRVCNRYNNAKFAVVYLEGMSDGLTIGERMISPLQEAIFNLKEPLFLKYLSSTILQSPSPEILEEETLLYERLLDGYALVFAEGHMNVLSYDIKLPIERSPMPPISENVIFGPHIGFNENMLQNYILIRQRLHSLHLAAKNYVIGNDSKSKTRLVYLDHLVDEKIVQIIDERLQLLNVNALTSAQQLSNLICAQPHALFPTMQLTERPDSVVSALLDGKCVIIVDGVPQVLIAPVTLFDFFVSSEDNYLPFPIGLMLRYLRTTCFFIALFLPGIFIALVAYHPELVPLPLIVSFAGQREGVPFPTTIEVLLMSVMFDIIQEASIRLPKNISGAVSIIGALVIGQSAVEARIVSAAVVIIIALTGLCGFVFQSYSMSSPIRFFRYVNIIAASMLGGVGLMSIATCELLLLCSMESFSKSYLFGLTPIHFPSLRKIFLEFPIAKWKKRMKKQ